MTLLLPSSSSSSSARDLGTKEQKKPVFWDKSEARRWWLVQARAESARVYTHR